MKMCKSTSDPLNVAEQEKKSIQSNTELKLIKKIKTLKMQHRKEKQRFGIQEAGHGKGAPDGIGAVIKRTADYQVKCQQDVGTFDVFRDVIQKHVKNVVIETVREHEIKIKDLMLPKDIMTFKGSMGVIRLCGTLTLLIWSSENRAASNA